MINPAKSIVDTICTVQNRWVLVVPLLLCSLLCGAEEPDTVTLYYWAPTWPYRMP